MHKLVLSTLLVILLVCWIESAPFNVWEAYQDNLVNAFSKQYPKLKSELSDEKDTFTHLVTTPSFAQWNEDSTKLSQDVCLFPPKFSLDYQPLGTTDDSTTPKLLEKMLKSLKTPKPFIEFMKSSGGKFDWKEVGTETLSSFLDRVKKESTESISFNVNGVEHTQTTLDFSNLNIDYEKLNSYIDEDSQAESFAAIDQIKKDFIRIESKKDDDEDLWFLPKYETHYDIDFQAKGIAAIKVKPDGWFNHKVLREHQSELKSFMSVDGKFPLLQDIIWVCYKPRVTIHATKKTYDGFVSAAASPDFAVSVGSMYFQPKTGNDDDDTNVNGDRIIFNGPSNDNDELFFNGQARNVHSGIFAPPKLTNTQTFDITLESNSEIPQIIAITSVLLPE